MATRAKGEAKPSDVRGKIVDALMELASEQRFEEISIRDICKAADVSLADFRDAFPSKGAVVAGLSRASIMRCWRRAPRNWPTRARASACSTF